MDDTYVVDSHGSDEDVAGSPPKLSFDDEGESDLEEGASATSKTMKRVNSNTDVKAPSFPEMIVAAIQANADRKGTSLQSIKSYLKGNFLVGDQTMKRRLKPAIEKCLSDNKIERPKAKAGTKPPVGKETKLQEQQGITGRFKLTIQEKKSSKNSDVKSPKKRIKNGAKGKSQKTNKASQKVGKQIKNKEESLAVKLAKRKVKQARMSLAVAASKETKLPTKSKIVKQAKSQRDTVTELAKSKSKLMHAPVEVVETTSDKATKSKKTKKAKATVEKKMVPRISVTAKPVKKNIKSSDNDGKTSSLEKPSKKPNAKKNLLEKTKASNGKRKAPSKTGSSKGTKSNGKSKAK